MLIIFIEIISLFCKLIFACLCLTAMIMALYSWEQMLMHHGTESSTLGFVGKDYSSLSSHPSGIVVVINSYGQPGKWFMLLAPLLVLDVYMDFYVFFLGRHIYFICQFSFLCLEFESCCWFYIGHETYGICVDLLYVRLRFICRCVCSCFLMRRQCSYLIYTEAKKLPNFLLNKLVQRFSLKLNHSILKIVVDVLQWSSGC